MEKNKIAALRKAVFKIAIGGQKKLHVNPIIFSMFVVDNYF